ncbi:MAG: CHRD domain-containing protein [Bryobacterales bacterium]|nr:CHRD domain-containing protein [Bryobacterales bacterium]
MKRALLSLVVCAAAAFGQTAETHTFLAPLSSANEVPPITDLQAAGTALLTVNMIRNAEGEVLSGSVEFKVAYRLPGVALFTGLHIHRGAAGANGPVTLDSGVRGGDAATPSAESGQGIIIRQGQALPTNANALQTLRDLLTNPGAYYVNLHTTTHPGGIIRGQLRRAETTVLISRMTPANEVPPIAGLDASGLGVILAARAYDPNGSFAGGMVTFDVSYAFPSDVSLTGLHIHSGVAGVNGPVTINTGLRAGGDPTSAGRLIYDVEVTAAAAINTLNGLFEDPEDYYLNLHTTVNPGGAIRAQLTEAEAIRLTYQATPAEEVPPIADLDATGPGAVEIHALRGPEGIAAAAFTFIVNHRFPGETRFTGLHIHRGARGANGGVVINSGMQGGANAVLTETGFGNLTYRAIIQGGAALTALNDMLANPEQFYVNLHTTVHPGGAVRAQIADPRTALPAVSAIISAVSDPSLTASAPGGLATIFGTDFSKVASPVVGGLDKQVQPLTVNGTSVTIAGLAAPIVGLGYEPEFAISDYLVVQVPVEATPGIHPVVVKTSNGESAAAQIEVKAVAPALYFDAEGAIAATVPAGAFIRRATPAQAGDQVAFFGTGFGVSQPPLATGQIPGETVPVAAPLTVTIGGRPAPVLLSGTVPGLLGLNFVVATVPAGVSGTVPVVVQSGDTSSNSTLIPVR